LGLNPTAIILASRQYGLGASYYTERDEAMGERRRCYSIVATFGVGGGTEVGLFQSRWVLTEGDSYKASGVTVKRRLAKNLAAGFSLFEGQVDGLQLFVATRIPLTPSESKRPLEVHLGILHIIWQCDVGIVYPLTRRCDGQARVGERTLIMHIMHNEELLPYAGLVWKVSDRWQLTGEMRDRQDFARKPMWLLAVHFKLNHSWQLSFGAVQSGFSDNSRPFIALSFGAGIFSTGRMR